LLDIQDISYRWKNKVNPNLTRGKFTKHEDEIIKQVYQQIGPKWHKVMEKLPNRSENMIKNRFYSHLKKQIN